MTTWGNVRRAYLAVVVLAGLCVGLNAGESGQKGQKGQQDKKGGVVEIDLSKLSPELAARLRKELDKQSQPKTAGDEDKGKGKGKGKKGKVDEDQRRTSKTLTLTQAIAIAEKLTKGSAYRAEFRKSDRGVESFRIEIQDKLGKRRVDLSPSGEVLKNDTRKGD
jgi:uncharacterized membrane protein YkoI